VGKRITSILGLFLLTLSFCSTWQAIQGRNRKNLLRLELDMTKEEVLRIMGTPNLNEAYKLPDEGSLLVWFYYTNRKWANGNITKDECMPLVFENGKLIGWGDEFYVNKIKVAVEIIKKYG